jgi:hypothetical protein
MSPTNTSRCPFEHIQNPEQEAEQIAETTDLTFKLLDKRYPPPKQILRGVHPKSHGCVKATFFMLLYTAIPMRAMNMALKIWPCTRINWMPCWNI